MIPLRLARSIVRIAWRNVRKNWRHSTASLLSIVAGFIAIGMFEGYLQDLMSGQIQTFAERGMYGDILIERRGATSPEGKQDPIQYALGPGDQKFLDGYFDSRAAEIRDRARFLNVSGMATRAGTNAMFVGIGYDVVAGTRLRGRWAWDAVAGKPLHLQGQDQDHDGLLVGKGFAASLDCTPQGRAPLTDRSGRPTPEARPFSCEGEKIQLAVTTAAGQANVFDPVVGGLVDAVIKEVDDHVVFMPLGAAQRLIDSKLVSLYSVALAQGVNAHDFGRALENEARKAGFDLQVTPWWDHPRAELVRRSINLLSMYRTFVAIVVVAIAGMSVLTMMMRSVSERTREIGTLRSLGFVRRQVIGLFAVEAALLATVASAIGMVLTVSLSLALNAANITYKGGVLSSPISFAIKLSPAAYIFATLFLGTIAAAAAALAARRAVRLTIPAALGHT
jgi:putative ABC transport system permease protein